MAKTPSQLKKSWRKAQRSMGSSDYIDLYVNHMEQAEKKDSRISAAFRRYINAVKKSTAKSKFRNYTQARKALVDFQKANSNMSEFKKRFEWVNTPQNLERLRKDNEALKEWRKLTNRIDAAERELLLAELVFPKLRNK